jgi:anti-sigma-K factor RskA
MSWTEDHGPEPEGDDLVAAEYVLGVLSAGEREAAARRVETDAAFARLVTDWQKRLAALDAGYGEIEPPASVKAALDARLFQPAAAASAPSGLFASLAFWRGMSIVALAAIVVLAALPFLREPPGEVPTERLVAALAAEGSEVSYLVVYDGASGEIALSRLAGEPGDGSDFELWVIEGDNPPASLGVVPEGETGRLAASPDLRQRIAGGVVFAISLEPDGGSPTGQPTGPVVAAGELRVI